jgi:release factor glutamine methyltransferase
VSVDRSAGVSTDRSAGVSSDRSAGMSVDQALADARARVGGASPGADARLLMGHVLGRDGAWLLAHGDEPLAADAAARLAHLVASRAEGVPVPYLTGEAWFFGRRFAVTRDVLVPRPETETLVEHALAFLRARSGAHGDRERSVSEGLGDRQESGAHGLDHHEEVQRVCDVGTGSGAIAVALACAFPEAAVTAIDISPATLAVAEANAAANGVAARVRIRLGDLLEGLDGTPPFDCITANLPYVPAEQIPGPPDPLAFEPRLALDGGADGLALYRRLLRRVPERLACDGGLLLEAAPPTIDALAALTRAALPDATVEVVADAGGLARLIVARRGRGEREAVTA